MKRILVIISILSMIFGITAFQCDSTEITSGKLYIQQKNLDRAEEVLLKEVEKNPKSDEGFYLLGYVYGEKGNYEKMLDAFGKSLAISQKFADDIDKQRQYHWAQNFNRGVALFNRAGSQENVDSAEVYFDKSIESFKIAIKCQPDSMDTYNNLVYAYLNKGDIDAAIPPLEKMIDLGGTADAYSRLGEIYYSKGAEKLNEFAVSKSPSDSSDAQTYFEKAITILKEGSEKYPGDEPILLYLQNAYVNAGMEEEAITLFRANVEKNPDDKVAHYNYGSLLLNAKNYEEAEKHLKLAYDMDNEYENAIYNLAVTYVRWGVELRDKAEAAGEEVDDNIMSKFVSAQTFLEKIVAKEPGVNDPAMWELLGRVYAFLGETEKSEDAFQKADQL